MGYSVDGRGEMSLQLHRALFYMFVSSLCCVHSRRHCFTCSDCKGRINWNYHLEDGRCMDSMALVTAKKYGLGADIIQRAQELAQQFDTLCRNDTLSAELRAVAHAEDEQQQRLVDAQERSTEEHTVQSWADEERPAGRRYNLNSDVAPILRSLAGDGAGAVQIIPAAWDPPVGLEGSSCVYVLQLYSLTKVRC
jgi:hypothetical protein